MKRNASCPFKIIYSYWFRKFEVAIPQENGILHDEMVETVIAFHGKGMKSEMILSGRCWTDACDRERVLAAAPWMLSGSKSYPLVQDTIEALIKYTENRSKPIQCSSSPSAAGRIRNAWHIELNGANITAECSNDWILHYARLTTIAKVDEQNRTYLHHRLEYYCDLDSCDRQETVDRIFNMIWNNLGMSALLQSDNSTNIVSTDNLELFETSLSTILPPVLTSSLPGVTSNEIVTTTTTTTTI